MSSVQKVEREAWGAGLRGCGDAKQEARQIFGLLGKNGDTVESLRKLIAVPPRAEALLRAFARERPENQHGIEQMLAYRRRVGEEFERLVRQNADDQESRPAMSSGNSQNTIFVVSDGTFAPGGKKRAPASIAST